MGFFLCPGPYSVPPGVTVLVANTLKSSANINAVGHLVGFYFEFYPKRRLIFLIVMVFHHTFMLILVFHHSLENIETHPHIILEYNFNPTIR